MTEALRKARGAVRRLRGGEAGPATYDSWLSHYWDRELSALDASCRGAGAEALPLFRDLPDDLWTVLLSGEQSLYPGIGELLPDLPPPEMQLRWNGAEGIELLNQGKAFYLRAKRLCSEHLPVPLSEAEVLDYGCGWGRLTRFFARDVAPGSLFGCDPVEEILEVCRRTGVPATLARSEFVPERLPFDRSFDLVFAFSVFTHLSEPAHRSCLDAIHASLAPGGLLVLTVRPPAYLDTCELLHPVRDSFGGDPMEALREPCYLFAPHPAEPEHPQFQGEEMTYGETVISLPYIRERWSDRFEMLGVSLLSEDPHQVVVAARRRG